MPRLPRRKARSREPSLRLLLAASVLGAAAAAAAQEIEVPEEQEAPLRGKTETVSVVLGESALAPLGASSTAIDPVSVAGSPVSVADLAIASPGVSENGQGGLFQVVSIRGVSRQRVLSLVSGVRVSSERRAGASASFVDPLLLDSVDVLRGPATTYHGSGAMGGVVDVGPRRFEDWTFTAGYDTVGDENYQLVGTAGKIWSVGLVRRSAGNAEAPDGTTLDSGFTQYGGVLRFDWGGQGLHYHVLAIPTRGEEIGKASTDSPGRTTTYPLERHLVLKFSAEARSGWRLDAWAHPSDLETEVVEESRRSVVLNETFDSGLRWQDRRRIGERTTLRFGADAFGRRGVDATELDYGSGAPAGSVPAVTRPLDGASETELGAWGSVRLDRSRTHWELGARWARIEQGNGGSPGVDGSAWNAHAGFSRSLGQAFELRASLATGVRFPSLTELFYSGVTGRGEVVANPDLAPERSLNAELSLRWSARGVVVSASAFRNAVDDYIERVEVAPGLLSFVNDTSGTIRGVELQGLSRPGRGWETTWGGHLIRGESSDGRTLQDTPPDELFAGAARAFGPWRADARLTWRAARPDPGPGEKPIPSAAALAATLRYRVSPAWEVAIDGTNLLDETYFRSADELAPLAPRRGFGVSLVYRGGARGEAAAGDRSRPQTG